MRAYNKATRGDATEEEIRNALELPKEGESDAETAKTKAIDILSKIKLRNSKKEMLKMKI